MKSETCIGSKPCKLYNPFHMFAEERALKHRSIIIILYLNQYLSQPFVYREYKSANLTEGIHTSELTHKNYNKLIFIKMAALLI